MASNCGASYADIIPGSTITAAPIIGGQWNLGISNHDTHAIRFIRLQQFLEVTCPSLIFYEEVKFTGSGEGLGAGRSLQSLVARAVSGAQVVHSLSAILITWAETRNIPCEAVPVGTLKQFATGKGNAGKEAMIQACNERFGTEFDPADYKATGADNIADSMFLCAMAVEHYSQGME